MHLLTLFVCFSTVERTFSFQSLLPRDSNSMATSLGDNYSLLSPQQVRFLFLYKCFRVSTNASDSDSDSDSVTQQELVKMLIDNGQGHLFNDWPGPGVDDDEKKAFFDQVCSHYLHPFNSKSHRSLYFLNDTAFSV